jgi:polyphosphate glucokinase
MRARFGIDIGGSGVKGGLVDLDAGELVSKRYRKKTPQPSTPDAVLDTAARVVDHFGYDGPVGCAVPAVVRRGVVMSAANIDDSWIGADGATMLAERLGQEVTLLNDADAAGLAEMRFGAGRGHEGVVLVLTFGTGIGSALFYQGVLIPNTELGHLRFRGMEAEHYAAARLVEREEMKLDWWASRVNEFLHHVDMLFSPDLIIFGGGISKRFADFAAYFDPRSDVVPAVLRNNAGIVGAAMACHEVFDLS